MFPVYRMRLVLPACCSAAGVNTFVVTQMLSAEVMGATRQTLDTDTTDRKIQLNIKQKCQKKAIKYVKILTGQLRFKNF